ncbi:hypothetical protein BDA99DRAFT_271950 [Phascolomyces articulosus]|uniref:Uncharacterized protein n=1 Tax=Phascolomyces articulosus TaxID=60185 RepID=A0AAD5JNA3_9FUNG|nr:hypothetical protein BDA99DRAFT_271950 [Phascolomyces articulosus]
MILVRDMISRLNQHQESIVDLVIGNNHKNIEKLAVTTTITTATTLLLYYMIKKITSKDIDPTPVIPYRWPILGSSIEYFKDKKKFAKEKTEQYGPVFRVHLFGQMVTVVDGNTAHEVFMNPNLDFIKSTHKYFDVPKLLTGLRYDMPENMFRDFIIKEMAQKLPKHSNHFDEECTNVAAEVLGNLKGME